MAERTVLKEEKGNHVEIDWEGEGWYCYSSQHDSLGEFTRLVKASEPNGDVWLAKPEDAKA